MTIRIADQGEGFDFGSLPDPLAEENLLKHSGRGIFLMRAFMDEVDIRPSATGWHRLTLTKKKTCFLNKNHFLSCGGNQIVSIKLNSRQVGDVTVVDVAGRITLGEGFKHSSRCTTGLADKRDKRNFCLNLGEVSYIDSSGIGELVSAFTTVTNQGGQLKLLGVNKRIKDLLQITKLYTVFEVRTKNPPQYASFS